MSDETQERDVPAPNSSDSDGDSGTDSPSVEELRKELESAKARIKELNKEAADRRHEAKREAEARQRLLEEQGEYKPLYEEAKSRLEGYQTLEQRTQSLESVIQAGNEARIAQIPEHMRTLVPEGLTPEGVSKWLDKNLHVLTVPPAPQTDAGVQGNPAAGVKLSSEELEAAAIMEMTPEEYAEYKKSSKAR